MSKITAQHLSQIPKNFVFLSADADACRISKLCRTTFIRQWTTILLFRTNELS